MMKGEGEIILSERLASKIFLIRGKKVVLDQLLDKNEEGPLKRQIGFGVE
jgi:hypothetical protein